MYRHFTDSFDTNLTPPRQIFLQCLFCICKDHEDSLIWDSSINFYTIFRIYLEIFMRASVMIQS